MKVAVCFLACLVGALAFPAEQEQIDWHLIKPNNRYVQPIGPAPPQLPGSRIVGGTVATRNAYPYQVALVVNDAWFCGGSIISATYVLTAAHCVDERTFEAQVIVGAHNPSTTVNEPTQVTLRSTSRVYHAQWSPDDLRNDIALIRLTSIPIGNTGISAIALAPANAGSFAGSTGVLTGWGLTSDDSDNIATYLHRIDLPIITNAACENAFGDIILASHLCTSGQGRVGSCNGDSGGPLVVGGVEVGIVSFGTEECESGYPSAFTRVSYFRSWIEQNSGI